MGLFGDIGGLVGGFMTAKGQAKKNKRAKDQFASEKNYAGQQIDIAKYIQGLAKEIAGKDFGSTDYYGSSTRFNPVTGKYEQVMGDVPRAIQDASDIEEQKRYTLDQMMRREAMTDIERNRQLAGGAERQALGAMGRFNEGIGKVDAGNLASSIRLNRERTVNAGYDDAERAARTLQLRTGSGGITDALSGLARDRVRAQAEIGDPATEAFQLAEAANSQRYGQLGNSYGVFGSRATMAPDVSFDPSQRANDLNQRLLQLMGLDLAKYETAAGASGMAASAIGSAAAGQRAGYLATEGQRTVSPWGQAIAAGGQSLDKIIASLFPAPGMGG